MPYCVCIAIGGLDATLSPPRVHLGSVSLLLDNCHFCCAWMLAKDPLHNYIHMVFTLMTVTGALTLTVKHSQEFTLLTLYTVQSTGLPAAMVVSQHIIVETGLQQQMHYITV